MNVEIVDGALTRELRRSVLRPNLTRDQALPGDDLADAVHFAVLEGGSAVSACWVVPAECPWRPEDRPAWQLRQMATAESVRGRGLGSSVVTAVVGFITANGGGVLWCNARERAVPMYARSGFGGEGAIFTDERHPIPHLRMWRRVVGQTGAANQTAGPPRLEDVTVPGPVPDE
jgi:predicted GNAT family N-acyltransferase